MTSDDDSPSWPPAAFTEQLQSASEDAFGTQQEMFKRWMSMMSGTTPSPQGIFPMGMGVATFKTRVQSGGRISIPDAEREALDIDDGDIVQAIIVPIKRGDDNE